MAPFTRIFVCRSGAWTSPWLDQAFLAFLAAAPVARHVGLQPVLPRHFDEREARALTTELASVAKHRR